MNIYDVLKELKIAYEEIEHEAVYTIEESLNVTNSLGGIGCKNLFLKDKKGNYILVILEENKKANIKEVENATNLKKLSFASTEDLKNILGLYPGSVSPFGLINDHENKTIIVIDNDLKNNNLQFHPNTNTKTMLISYNDLIKFLDYTNHHYIYF